MTGCDRVTPWLLLWNKVQLHSASAVFHVKAFASPCSLLRTAGRWNDWLSMVEWPSRFIDHLGAVDYGGLHYMILYYSGL